MLTTSLAPTASRVEEQNPPVSGPRSISGSLNTEAEKYSDSLLEYIVITSPDDLRYVGISNNDIGAQQDRSISLTKIAEHFESVNKDTSTRLVRVIRQNKMISVPTDDLQTYSALLYMWFVPLDKFFSDADSPLFAYKPSAHGTDVQAAASGSTLPLPLPVEVEAELEEFSVGLDGVRPTAYAMQIARTLSEAAVRHVPHPEITVDIDGELSFDMRLKDGRLVFAELGPNGQIDVGVYGPDNQMLKHNAEATCEHLLSIIES